jgi:AAA domain
MSDLPLPSLAGPNILLMGPAGSGKTHSLGTLVESGVEVFYLGLEAGLESLLGYFTDRGKPVPPNLHYHVLKAPDTSFLDMADSATKINTYNLEALAKMNDPNRSRHNQFISLLTVLSNFTCQRDGKSYGAVNDWHPSRALAVDGLTGVNNAALSLVVGGKPVRSQSDWGIAQQQVESLLRKLCDGCSCWFILLAHVEREQDQVLGGVKLMASTLGKALAPKIPAMFSDVILTVRDVKTWKWDTANSQADLKTRNLDISGSLPPSFAPIVAKWLARGGTIPSPKPA